jgi:hypothetical protein
MKHYLSCLVFLSVFLLCPGCGGDEITQSGREYQEEFAGAVCSRIVSCNEGGSVADCVDLLVSEFCAGAPRACERDYTMPAESWDTCLDAMYGYRCDALGAGLFPDACDDADAIVGLY